MSDHIHLQLVPLIATLQIPLGSATLSHSPLLLPWTFRDKTKAKNKKTKTTKKMSFSAFGTDAFGTS